jgi:hypothetical protein
MLKRLILLLIPLCTLALTITESDYNYGAGISGDFYYLTDGTWEGFDSGEDSWDFSGITSSNYAEFDVLSKSASPHGGDFPDADYAERIIQDDVGEVWFYSSLDGAYRQHGATLPWSSLQFKVEYDPVIDFWDLPLSVGTSWNYDFTYDFWVAIIHVIVNESHDKEIVAEGRVKVPASGDDWWPCLVLREHAVVDDNWDQTDKDVWIYGWIVPDGFIGQSGVASIESVDGAGPDFTSYSKRYVLATSNISPDPWSVVETSWGAIKAAAE